MQPCGQNQNLNCRSGTVICLFDQDGTRLFDPEDPKAIRETAYHFFGGLDHMYNFTNPGTVNSL